MITLERIRQKVRIAFGPEYMLRETLKSLHILEKELAYLEIRSDKWLEALVEYCALMTEWSDRGGVWNLISAFQANKRRNDYELVIDKLRTLQYHFDLNRRGSKRNHSRPGEEVTSSKVFLTGADGTPRPIGLWLEWCKTKPCTTNHIRLIVRVTLQEEIKTFSEAVSFLDDFATGR